VVALERDRVMVAMLPAEEEILVVIRRTEQGEKAEDLLVHVMWMLTLSLEVRDCLSKTPNSEVKIPPRTLRFAIWCDITTRRREEDQPPGLTLGNHKTLTPENSRFNGHCDFSTVTYREAAVLHHLLAPPSHEKQTEKVR